ncbi:MAG: FeoB-associated Cys-rich membrane protein [Butyrivibrio sp.]|nr:FeoB-associated Cys-rich membrane protein [Butyrivibrio sp.]
MTDFIVIVIIVMILGLAIRYIYKEKKKGVHCIGCPSAGACHKATCSCKNK